MDPLTIQRQLRRLGFRPQQAAGQNFLLEESVAESMVQAAGIEAGDIVLEIGPGLGVLTEPLLRVGARVIAVEIDQRLHSFLRRHFRDQKNLQLLHQDIFRVNIPELFLEGKYKLVANLPYSSTSLIFRNFLSLAPRPTSMTVMIQRDVAQRITAPPGDMSTLSVMVQYYSRPEVLFDVPPTAFYPTPKVTSSVLYADITRPIGEDDSKFFRLVKAGFSARRKQLKNNLAASLRLPLNTVESALEKVGLINTVRAQELAVENWLELAKNLS